MGKVKPTSPIEREIIGLNCPPFNDETKKKLNLLPLGSLSDEMLNFLNLEYHKKDPELYFRLRLELYIQYKQKKYLAFLESSISKLISSPVDLAQNKKAGTYAMPEPVYTCMREVWLLKDPALIFLFKKYFPRPRAEVFKEGEIPEEVKAEEKETFETLYPMVPKLGLVEPWIIRAQRRYLKNKRRKQELIRIAFMDERYLSEHQMTPETFLMDANTPYKPQCEAKLSQNLLEEARWVSKNRPAFTEIKHITWQKSLTSIGNIGLLGQEHLKSFYMSFTPAALGSSDVSNGDADAICFGPYHIDPSAGGNIILVFDLNKLIKKKNLPAFFKQRDLEYTHEDGQAIRSIQLGNETLFFNHTPFYSEYDGIHSNDTVKFQLLDKTGEVTHNAFVQKSSLIAYDLDKMHEILIMNFFRFFDKLTPCESKDKKPDRKIIDAFYRKLGKLPRNERIQFLIDLEPKIADTGEVNIKGAHQIDFSTLNRIIEKNKNYTLDLAYFRKNLREGKINALRLARQMIPELFQTYRFVDYLLSTIPKWQEEVLFHLDALRQKCETPAWITYEPLEVPEGAIISWEVDPSYVETPPPPPPSMYKQGFTTFESKTDGEETSILSRNCAISDL